MKYFRLKSAHLPWLEMEIAKGTIFYKHYSFATPEWVPCGAYREDGASYDSMTAGEVLRMIAKDKNVYWRN
ncbi:hypothetical protein POP15_270 [Pectobacterium phage POP15]|nr:hypothetical protein POP15_270 [Pectobacterium phage POP15]